MTIEEARHAILRTLFSKCGGIAISTSTYESSPPVNCGITLAENVGEGPYLEILLPGTLPGARWYLAQDDHIPLMSLEEWRRGVIKSLKEVEDDPRVYYYVTEAFQKVRQVLESIYVEGQEPELTVTYKEKPVER